MSEVTSSLVAEQYRQQREGKQNHITITEQDNGEKLCERCKKIINSVAEVVPGIMELANKGTWLMVNARLPQMTKTKHFKKMQQGYGTRSLIEEYKDKRRKEKNNS